MNPTPQHLISRRRLCLCCVGAATFAATGSWLRPSEVFAEARNLVELIRSDAATAPISVHRLRGNVSVLEGSGGNIAVLTGPDGKLLIDGGITASRPRIVAALASLSSNPVKQLINTHWHFDHADGNEWLHSEGASILAHENTRKHLASAQRVDDWNFDFPASPSGAIPSDTFTTNRVLKINGSTVQLKHYGSAHTDSDISVTFTEADILHTGDTYWNGLYPFIDYPTGGGISGMIQAAEANLAATTERTVIIPGHGRPVSNRSELKESREMLVAVRDNVAALKQQGRSLDETIAANPTKAYDAKWGQFPVDPPLFTRLVYEGV